MKRDEVEARVRAIRDAAGDDECAHAMEDALYADVLAAIASGDVEADDVAEIAGAVFATRDIQFERWCA